ncbi:hypothetical protein OIM90_31000 [Streptomyces sp. AD16]|nr:hypothetical protein OIM90_31000 [Streptomyces sp. AD16]
MTGELTDADTARMARAGMPPIDPDQGLALFDAVTGAAEQAPAVLPVQLDLGALRSLGEVPPLFRSLIRVQARRAASDGERRPPPTSPGASPASPGPRARRSCWIWYAARSRPYWVTRASPMSNPPAPSRTWASTR